MHAYMFVYVHANICICTYIYVYMHIFTCMHTPSRDLHLAGSVLLNFVKKQEKTLRILVRNKITSLSLKGEQETPCVSSSGTENLFLSISQPEEGSVLNYGTPLCSRDRYTVGSETLVPA